MTSAALPDSDEVEVSLLGPGIGESVVIHLGQGDWMVVDSCRDRGSAMSAPLEYLRSIGVHVASQVKRIVATHAHTDHIEGLADVVAACKSAEVVHPQASESSDFYTLLQLDDMSEQEPRAYDEFSRIIDILIARRAALGRIPRIAVKETSLVFRRSSSGSDSGVEVLALAPSDAAVALAIQEFGRWRNLKGQTPGRVRARDPNTYCAALWVSVGDVKLLLGSDLLIGPGKDCGWNGVLVSPVRPREMASCFKVPHHGAPNAHHPKIWEEMLEENVLALLTPYWGGHRPRPQPDDQLRICALTNRAYITCKPGLPSQPDAVRKDAAYLRSVGRNVRLRKGFVGHVRARRKVVPGSEWEVTLVSPARPLCA